MTRITKSKIKATAILVAFMALVAAFYISYEVPFYKTEFAIKNADSNETLKRTPIEKVQDKLTLLELQIDTALSSPEIADDYMLKKYSARLSSLKEKVAQKQNDFKLLKIDSSSELVKLFAQKTDSLEEEVKSLKREINSDLVANRQKLNNKINTLIAEVETESESLQSKTSQEVYEIQNKLNKLETKLQISQQKLEASTKEQLNEIKKDVNTIEEELSEAYREIKKELNDEQS